MAEGVIIPGERMDDLNPTQTKILLSKLRSLNQRMAMVRMDFIYHGYQIPLLTHQNSSSRLENLSHW